MRIKKILTSILNIISEMMSLSRKINSKRIVVAVASYFNEVSKQKNKSRWEEFLLVSPKAIFFLFFLTVIFVSCEKRMNIDLPYSSPQLVINSKMIQDSTFNVQVYRTSFITDNYTNLCYIDTATVNVYSDNIFIEALTLSSQGMYTGIYRIKPNTDYQLNVSVETFPTATTTAQTLDRIEILTIDSANVFVDGETEEKYINFAVCFNDKASTKDYYMIDFSESGPIGGEKSTIFSKDPAIEMDDGSHTADGITTYGNYYFTDELFNGRNYAFSIFVPTIKAYGGFVVNLSHITPEYFKYIQTIKAQGAGGGDEELFFSQAVQVYNNIKNGVGIFGALSSSTRRQKLEYSHEESIEI